ncbi:hypothetical protein FACS189435_4290 [Bacteroidia bacterium]|nr:hypothetical protein FACS189435_4290 [Bacteroidia bacterium]
MKKKNIYAVLVVALALAVSCMSEGGQKVSVGNYPGVVVKHGDSAFIYLKGHEMIYSATGLQNLNDGDCVIADFLLDYSLKENADSGKVKGFLTVSLKKVTPLPQLPLSATLTDTATALPGERVISSVYGQEAFILDKFFLFTAHRPDSFPLLFNLSYDPKMAEEEVYDLYLRVNVEESEAKASQPLTQANAFLLEELSRRETDSLFFRINYVRQFNADSTVISWASTPVYRYSIFK